MPVTGPAAKVKIVEATSESSTGPKNQLLVTVLLVLASLLGSFLITSFIVTDSLTFGYNVPNWRKYAFRQKVDLTPAELLQYDGTDLSKPIYIAINGKIYDVSASPQYYGKGGGYHFFAGKDAARAYVTGCFQTDLTHDLRGLDDAQIKLIHLD
ncbi:hypothetical protein HKX48_003047 [Thoreauomyces humboldtii]|nr:hypothetical protein HKX48_003047 [Thoreauomyces humboldtii]